MKLKCLRRIVNGSFAIASLVHLTIDKRFATVGNAFQCRDATRDCEMLDRSGSSACAAKSNGRSSAERRWLQHGNRT